MGFLLVDRIRGILVKMRGFIGRVLFRVSRVILYKLNVDISLSNSQAQYPELTPKEVDFLRQVFSSSITMTSFESLATLALACKYIVKSEIPGDFVEAGVWRGGSSIVAKCFLTGVRTFYLYDTYKGMTTPTVHDYRVGERTNTRTFNHWQKHKRSTHNEWVFADLEEVKSNFRNFKLLDESCKFIEGNVLDTLKTDNVPQNISLLRLDTDFYDSTLCELQVLWPRLVKGGILILDDYGHWDGARRAVDEYFHEEEDFFMIPIAGGGGRIIQKR
jgi:hypothetical protein